MICTNYKAVRIKEKCIVFISRRTILRHQASELLRAKSLRSMTNDERIYFTDIASTPVCDTYVCTHVDNSSVQLCFPVVFLPMIEQYPWIAVINNGLVVSLCLFVITGFEILLLLYVLHVYTVI